MTTILLDTSGYSALTRGHLDIARAVREADRILVSAIVIGELLAGFRQGSRWQKNERELAAMLSSPRVEVAVVDQETSERYAVILASLRAAGTPIPTNDIWIAAGAMQHGVAVVTTDEHYLRVPQVIARYFDPHPKP